MAKNHRSPQVKTWSTALPNSKSPLATPASTRVDVHYAFLKIRERWTWKRYLQLCIRLNYTPAELASVVCLNHRYLQSCQTQDCFPGSACLLLTMLEARISPELPDVVLDPFQYDSPKGS